MSDTTTDLNGAAADALLQEETTESENGDSSSRRNRGGRSTAAYAKLRELIVSGSLAPGSRIIETDVADRLGVSRTPVRAALQRLEQEGYIDASGDGERSRPTVSPLTKEDARELFYLAGAIEGLAGRRTAALADEDRRELVERLRDANDRLSRYADGDRGDRNDFFELDRRFHRHLVDAGGAPRVTSLHDSVKPQAERYTQVYLDPRRYDVEASVEEHREIVRAIETGDPDAAEAAVEANWRRSESRLRKGIDQIGERGVW